MNAEELEEDNMRRKTLVQDNLMVLAKSKSAKMRSKMLKMVMPLLSRDDGEKLAVAIHNKDRALFDSIWQKIQHIIDGKLESHSADDVDVDLNDLYALITDNFDSLSADTDECYLIDGSSALSKHTQKLAAHGTVILSKQGNPHILTLNNVTFQTQATAFDMPTVCMEAVLTELGSKETISLSSEGHLGECYLDLVLRALHAKPISSLGY
jgi:hypothetical protein